MRYDRLSGRWIVTVITFSDTLSNNRVLVAVSEQPRRHLDRDHLDLLLLRARSRSARRRHEPLLRLPHARRRRQRSRRSAATCSTTTGVYQGTTVHVVRKSRVLSGAGGDLVAGRRRRRVPQPHRHARRPRALLAPGRRQPLRRGAHGILDHRRRQRAASGPRAQFRARSRSARPGRGRRRRSPRTSSLSVPATALPLTVPHLGQHGRRRRTARRPRRPPLRREPARRPRLDGAQHRRGRDRRRIRRRRPRRVALVRDRRVRRHSRARRSRARSSTRPRRIRASTGSRRSWSRARATPRSARARPARRSASTAATAGRLAATPPGTLQAPLLFTASATRLQPAGRPGPARRWGDYSFTSLDPNDDMTMWTIQEYCNATRLLRRARRPAHRARRRRRRRARRRRTIASGQASVSVVIDGISVGRLGLLRSGRGLSQPPRGRRVGDGVTVNARDVHEPDVGHPRPEHGRRAVRSASR